MNVEIREEQRESWGTRTGFILAAVGSAVGLGNLWGFPYKLYSYGGGAFLIPYVLALVLIGIPMLMLEFSLGHYSQRAAPDAFASAHRRFEFVGWWGIILGFVIITYYPVILAYCFSFLWESIKGILSGGELPWAGEGIAGVEQAKTHFFTDYLGHHESFSLGALRTNILVPLLIAWGAMYFCIFRGVKLVGKIVWLTVPLPWIMLLILAIRGLTLPGAGEGMAFYLNPDWAELAKPQTWRFAFGQVFFSLSLAFGVMITYASFLHRKSDINNNATIIGLADLATSFVAGLAIFATLGGMALASREAGQYIPVNEVVAGGPGLAFVAFPYALAQLPYSAWFSFVFFFALVTLGIDSAFSITESVLASIVDKTGWKRCFVLPVLSVAGLGMGLVYITNGGLNWLGTIDGFVNGTWGIAFMGMLECLVLGWLFRVGTLRQHANERSDWKAGKWWELLIRIVIPIVLGAMVTWSLFDDCSREGGLLMSREGKWLWPNVVGLGIVMLAPVLAIVLSAIPGVRQDTVGHTYETVRRPTNVLGLSLAVVSILLSAYAFVGLMALARAGGEGSATGPSALLSVALVLGLSAVVISYFAVERDTTDRFNPAWAPRWAGLLGTVGTGAAAGLFMAMRAMATVPPEAAPSGAEGLSDAAYSVLAVIGAILVLGLGWCFYRAIGAARSVEAQESQG